MGEVVRVGECGKIEIPQNIRDAMGIKKQDLLELFVDGAGNLMVKKYSKIKSVALIAKNFCKAISSITGCTVVVSDGNEVIASANMQNPIFDHLGAASAMEKQLAVRYCGWLIAPIVKDGKSLGAVCIADHTADGTWKGSPWWDELERIAKIAAAFLPCK